MTVNYYIDESGHSGDLINSGQALDFDGQPIFSLACIGVDDETRLASEINRLRLKHQITSAELKSISLKSKPGFTLDIVEFVCSESLPFFIEVVDKKYFLCMHIVNCHIAPPCAGLAHDFQDSVVWNGFADYLYDHAPITVFEKFIAACITPSERTLRESFHTLLWWAEQDSDENHDALYIYINLKESLGDYENMRQKIEDAHFKFLPLPDDSKHLKPIWMLPNYSSFCNIYARINLFHAGDLSGVRMIHDEQKHFDEIIKDAKQKVESILKGGDRAYTPYANFNFSQSAPLSFAESDRSSGIQVADVLAGFVMRYFKDGVVNAKSISPQMHVAFYRLLECSNPANGIGVNQVVPSRFA